ncbi:hypothetical protein EON67_10850, partial [archaeon]
MRAACTHGRVCACVCVCGMPGAPTVHRVSRAPLQNWCRGVCARAHVWVQVYDITRAETFRQLGDWLRELELYCTNGGRDVVKVLVGNKSDKEDERAVSTREAEAWARSRGMLFLEASARSEKNVQQVFEEAVQKVLEDPSLVAGTKPGAAPRATVRMDAPGFVPATSDGSSST